jgi:hypothetical protein
MDGAEFIGTESITALLECLMESGLAEWENRRQETALPIELGAKPGGASVILADYGNGALVVPDGWERGGLPDRR